MTIGKVMIEKLFDLICVIIAAIALSVFLVLFIEIVQQYALTGVDVFENVGLPTLFQRTLLLLVAVAIIGAFFVLRPCGIPDVLFRYRFLIGLLAIAIGTLLELSGSSIAQWGTILGNDPVEGTIFGIPRAVRSDEYLVNTPFAISQDQTGFAAVSTVIRGGSTDVTLVYGQPAWAFSILFRPFQWGYLLLGSSRGLSFFWCARLVVLLIVSLEFALLLSRGIRSASLAYALLVTFSPVVQWWFAINGLVEMIIFGQALVIALHHFLRAKRSSIRWLIALGMAWMAACYVLVIYPAWQVPLFWVFAAVGVADLVEYLKRQELTSSHLFRELVIPILVAISLLVAVLAVIFIPRMDVIAQVVGTAYPGERLNAGGGGFGQLFRWLPSLLNALWASEVTPNACELTGFFVITPIGLLFCLVTILRSHRIDSVLVGIFIVEFLLVCYVVFGLPNFVATITLLSHSLPERVGQVLGICDLIVLLRVTYLTRASRNCGVYETDSFAYMIGCIAIGVLALITSIILALIANNMQNLRLFFCALLFVFLLPLVWGVFRVLIWGEATVLLTASIAISIAGMCINPIQRGLNSLTQSDEYVGVAGISSEYNESLWAAENATLGQLCIAAGARCLNCVNVYPNVETWRKLDPKEESYEIYNRYAHISLALSDDVDQPVFSLLQADAFEVRLTPDDLKTLGVDFYISTSPGLDSLKGEARLMLDRIVGNLYVWRVI